MKSRTILAIFLALSALAQMGAPLPPGPAGGAAPPAPTPNLRLPRLGQTIRLPAWIRPGLIMAYSDPVGGQIAAAYLVTRTTETAAYGLAITAVYTQGAPMVTTEATVLWQNGNGLFHLDPAYVRALARAPTPEGMRITVEEGGITIVSQGQSGTSKTAIIFDPKSGVVLEFGTLSDFRKGKLAATLKYLGYHQIDWPVLGTFPPAARRAARYTVTGRVYNWTGGGAMEVPLGSVAVQPIRVALPLVQYRVVVEASGGFPMNQTETGLPAAGPHYLHPALLKRNPVYEIPQLGLRLDANGGDAFVLSLAGQPLVETRVDPSTGLVLEQVAKNPLGEQVVRLAQ